MRVLIDSKNMKAASLITNILTYGFYTLVALVVVLLFSSALPIPGGIKTFVVQSGSMEPSIRTGSVVVVKPFPSTGSGQVSAYQVGDVITFGPRSKTKPPTTHRIIEVKADGNFVTKGDANEEEDIRTVSRYEVIGKVVVSIPWVGYAVAAAQKPWGFAVIVVIPAVIIIWEEVGKIRGEIRKKRDYAARVEKREEKPASAGEEHNEKKEETI